MIFTPRMFNCALRLWLLGSLIFASAASVQAQLPTQQGKLLIVGGALNSGNAAVHHAFLNARPKHLPAIAIVPLASSSPVESAERFKAALIHYGASAEDIRILPLAVKDDRSTQRDERHWHTNSQDAELASSLADVGAFWFVGGDQMRIIDTLLPAADQPTPVLQALHKQLQRGAVIGGSSAGAAMMSATMIAAGDSFSALTLPIGNRYEGTEAQEQGHLYLHHGLGFFPYGVIDQHFDRKARLGRLARTLAASGVERGYGIDEDTGMLVDLAEQTFEVVGRNNVTVLNTRGSEINLQPFAAKNLSLALLSGGDRWSLAQDRLLTTQGKPTVGREYASEPPLQGAGMALANTRLDQLLGYQLLDNRGSREIRRYNFSEQGDAFMYRFQQTSDSEGYWSNHRGAADAYSIVGVTFSIEPLKVALQPLEVAHEHP